MYYKISLKFPITLIILLQFLLILCVSTSQQVTNHNHLLKKQYQQIIIDDENSEHNEINENLLTPKNSINKKQQRTKSMFINKDTITYIRASIPIRTSKNKIFYDNLFQCVRQLTILRCIKLFVLQKMALPNYQNSGNITKDFINQFFNENQQFPSLLDKRYKDLNDTELTNRLTYNFQKFFKDRDIKLHFIPGVMVQIIPSTENKIKLSLKKNEVSGRKRKDKNGSYKNTMIQMAVPVLMMPAILLGTFLPFILPAFKMATFMTTLLNNGALIAALLYAARTSAQQNDAEIIHYSHPGYH